MFSYGRTANPTSLALPRATTQEVPTQCRAAHNAEDFWPTGPNGTSRQGGENPFTGTLCVVKQDFSAVEAAVRQSWSNGRLEDQINRLKALKRQMSGALAWNYLAPGFYRLPVLEITWPPATE
jgi:hypothetical protein